MKKPWEWKWGDVVATEAICAFVWASLGFPCEIIGPSNAEDFPLSSIKTSLSLRNFNNNNNKWNSGPRLFLKQQENPPDLLLSSQNSAMLLETLLGSYMTVWNSQSREGFVFSHMRYQLFFSLEKCLMPTSPSRYHHCCREHWNGDHLSLESLNILLSSLRIFMNLLFIISPKYNNSKRNWMEVADVEG